MGISTFERIEKKSMTRKGLLKIIKKLQETREMGVLPGREQKHIPNETTEEVAIAVDPVSNILQRAFALSQEICLFPGLRCEKFCDQF